MNRVTMLTIICAGFMTLPFVMPVGAQDAPVPERRSDWPSFAGAPRNWLDNLLSYDSAISIGTRAYVPGVGMTMGLGMAVRVDPFFTVSQTELIVLPTWSITQFLETGLMLDWWSASVDVDLALSPWALSGTGGWLEFHPPTWFVAENPEIKVDGRMGWGPHWAPIEAWSHELDGNLDARANWVLNTRWDSPLDLMAQSILGATWTFTSNAFVADWLLTLSASAVLPLFQDIPAALRAGAVVAMHVLPTFGFGFDTILEFRANAFYAYGLIGAGGSGIHAEIGAELTFGVAPLK